MGKLRHLRRLRRDIRALQREEFASIGWPGSLLSATPTPAGAAAVQLGGGASAEHFTVGMRVSGPPEAFGLPASPESGKRHGMVVTGVDQERGVITLTTVAP